MCCSRLQDHDFKFWYLQSAGFIAFVSGSRFGLRCSSLNLYVGDMCLLERINEKHEQMLLTRTCEILHKWGVQLH
jgi:hypothetical protein